MMNVFYLAPFTLKALSTGISPETSYSTIFKDPHFIEENHPTYAFLFKTNSRKKFIRFIAMVTLLVGCNIYNQVIFT